MTFFLPQISAGTRPAAVTNNRPFGNAGSRTPQKLNPKSMAFISDSERVPIKNPNHEDLPKNANTEVSPAKIN